MQMACVITRAIFTEILKVAFAIMQKYIFSADILHSKIKQIYKGCVLLL